MDGNVQNESAHKYRLCHRVIRAILWNAKIDTYKVFVTGVPVNIHRNLARSWATTLLARVALKHEVSSVADK